jgi:formate dehydrogenase subunit gamma
MTERSLSEPGGAPPDAADPVVARVREIAGARATEPGPLIEILHDVQHEFGYLPDGAVTVVADVLNLSIAEVHGVQSFYADFRTSPPADVTVAICRGEACQAVGAEALVEHATSTLGCGLGEQTPDGTVGLEQIFCFGNCALGPTATIGGRMHGRMDAAKLDALVADARAACGDPS